MRKTRRSQETARPKVSVSNINDVFVTDLSNVIVDSTRRAPAVIDESESEQENVKSKTPPTKQSKAVTDEHEEVSSGAEEDNNDEGTEEQEETDLKGMKADKLKKATLAEVCFGIQSLLLLNAASHRVRSFLSG